MISVGRLFISGISVMFVIISVVLLIIMGWFVSLLRMCGRRKVVSIDFVLKFVKVSVMVFLFSFSWVCIRMIVLM